MVTNLSYRDEVTKAMQNVARARSFIERDRQLGLPQRDPALWQHRLEQLAKWLCEGIRLGVPLRTLATASGLTHPERVRRFVKRYCPR